MINNNLETIRQDSTGRVASASPRSQLHRETKPTTVCLTSASQAPCSSLADCCQEASPSLWPGSSVGRELAWPPPPGVSLSKARPAGAAVWPLMSFTVAGQVETAVICCSVKAPDGCCAENQRPGQKEATLDSTGQATGGKCRLHSERLCGQGESCFRPKDNSWTNSSSEAESYLPFRFIQTLIGVQGTFYTPWKAPAPPSSRSTCL